MGLRQASGLPGCVPFLQQLLHLTLLHWVTEGEEGGEGIGVEKMLFLEEGCERDGNAGLCLLDDLAVAKLGVVYLLM